jgi:hypothetical protein
MAERKIGEVIHWYGKAGVAVVRLTDSLKVGDTVKVKRGAAEFEAPVTSMQIEHQDIAAASAGQEAAVKLPQEAKEGAELYLAE